jgi:hypothetical protein
LSGRQQWLGSSAVVWPGLAADDYFLVCRVFFIGTQAEGAAHSRESDHDFILLFTTMKLCSRLRYQATQLLLLKNNHPKLYLRNPLIIKPHIFWLLKTKIRNSGAWLRHATILEKLDPKFGGPMSGQAETDDISSSFPFPNTLHPMRQMV